MCIKKKFLESFSKFYGKEEIYSMWRHPNFIKDESIFFLDVEYQLSLIYPTNLKTSKSQKFESSKSQKFELKAQKLKSTKALKLIARWRFSKLSGGMGSETANSYY
jgi:hypothetical protein